MPTLPYPDVVAALRAAGCVFAEDEARLLLDAGPADVAALVERRVAGEPLEHLLGWAEFCGRRVSVGPGVFVPRRRTELLVHLATPLLRPGGVVVELCCGAAAVATALAAAVPGLTVHAVDVDTAAVRCARRNLDPVGGHVHEGDLDDPLPAELRGHVDVVVANAPYVPSAAIALMPPEARDHEPPVALDGGVDGLDVQRRVAAAAPRWLAPGGSLLIETSERQAPLTVAAVAAGGLVPRVERDDERDATAVVGGPAVTAVNPARSTVVAWYAELPDALASLVARIHATGAALLGDAFTPRDPAQIHATLIGLERAADPFDPGPLAAHLHAALASPLVIQFGGVPRDDRRMLSRGLPLHERTFLAQVRGPEVETTHATGAASPPRQCRAVLVGWPVVDGVPLPAVAELRDSCAALGVTHRYGTDPDVYLVIADITAGTDRCTALETAVRAELATDPVHVPLSAADLCLVTYDDATLPRGSSQWRPLIPTTG